MTRVSLPPRFWWITALTLLGVCATGALGVWQLSRAGQKQALQALIEERPLLPRLDTPRLMASPPGSDLQYRSATLRGTWMPRHTVYLDNRQMYGKPGFFVLTPLLLEHSNTAVVVQRGWVQRSFVDRAQLPELPPLPGAVVEVAGRIAPPPSKLYEFREVDAGLIRQNLDLQRFAQEVGVPLLPLSLQQLGPVSGGLSRDWPAIDTGVAKHHGYAFQWFALRGLIALLYGWFQIVRRYISSR